MKKTNFLRFYLKFSIVVGLLGLLYPFRVTLLALPKPIYYFSWIVIIVVTILLWVYAILSIYSLIRFIKNKLDKLTFIIPVLGIILLALGILVGFVETLYNISLETYTFYLGIVIDIFVIVFAFILLKKYK